MARKRTGSAMTPPLTEKQMQVALVRAAKQLGYLVYHAAYAIGSEPGFPDLTIVGKGRFWMLELKGPKGRVSEAQEAWMAHLQAAGVDARIVWPTDYDTVMQELMDAYERTVA